MRLVTAILNSVKEDDPAMGEEVIRITVVTDTEKPLFETICIMMIRGKNLYQRKVKSLMKK